MKLNEEITGIVLAGGKSSRMGSNKATLTFRGKKFLDYSIDALSEMCQHIIVSANSDEYVPENLVVVPDNFKDIGPLGGLEACLKFSTTRINLFSTCDTPFIDVEILKLLVKNMEDYDAVVPVTADGKIHTLTACYAKRILPIVTQQIENKDYKIQHLLKKINTNYLETDNTFTFNNINTPADLKQLQQEMSTSKFTNPESNIIIIAGTGRNVGKTLLACQLIEHLSKQTELIAIKISHHFHAIESGQKIIVNTRNYSIIEEMLENNKDSSRMKKAGASKVFYIQTQEESVLEAFQFLSTETNNKAVIVESGGLHNYMQPALFFVVAGNEIPDNKKHLFEHNPIVLNSENGFADFPISNIQFTKNAFTINTSKP